MKTKKEFFKEISNKLDFDIEDYIILNDIENYEDLYDELQDKGAFEIEIIYYHKAIDYLKDNDASLSQSLELADDYGYKAKDLNSEKLATILATRLNEEKFASFYFEIDEFLTNYEKETYCYCGEEIEEGDFCSKECAKHYFSEIT